MTDVDIFLMMNGINLHWKSLIKEDLQPHLTTSTSMLTTRNLKANIKREKLNEAEPFLKLVKSLAVTKHCRANFAYLGLLQIFVNLTNKN